MEKASAEEVGRFPDLPTQCYWVTICMEACTCCLRPTVGALQLAAARKAATASLQSTGALCLSLLSKKTAAWQGNLGVLTHDAEMDCI